jgi:hypothetical protein
MPWIDIRVNVRLMTREPTSTIMMISPVEMDKGYGPGSSRIGIDNSPWPISTGLIIIMVLVGSRSHAGFDPLSPVKDKTS